MNVGQIIKKILGKDTSKNFSQEAYDSKSDIVYAPFRPYQDQFTPGRHQTGINIMQPVKRRKVMKK